MNQTYGSALQGHGGAAASAAPSGGFTNGSPLAAWHAPVKEDEVDAYEHLGASTDEDIEMVMGGPDYLAWSGATEEPMTPPPGPATHPYCSMSPSSWQNGQMPAGTHSTPSPASTEASAGGTRPARRLRRRLEGGVEPAVHTKPAPGGLGRVLDQKRVRLDRRQGTPGSGVAQGDGAAKRQRRLQTPKESHINKSPSRHRSKSPRNTQLGACLTRIERLDPTPGLRKLRGWWWVTCWEAIGAANEEQVSDEEEMDWISDEDQMDWTSDAEDRIAAPDGRSQEVDSRAGSEPAHESHRAEPAPTREPSETGAAGPGLMSSASDCAAPTSGPSSAESSRDVSEAARVQPRNAKLDPASTAAKEALNFLETENFDLAPVPANSWRAWTRRALGKMLQLAQAKQDKVLRSRAFGNFVDGQDDDDPDLQDPAEAGQASSAQPALAAGLGRPSSESSSIRGRPVVRPAARTEQDPPKEVDWEEL